jgi:hypothetical protein
VAPLEAAHRTQRRATEDAVVCEVQSALQLSHDLAAVAVVEGG